MAGVDPNRLRRADPGRQASGLFGGDETVAKEAYATERGRQRGALVLFYSNSKGFLDARTGLFDRFAVAPERGKRDAPCEEALGEDVLRADAAGERRDGEGALKDGGDEGGVEGAHAEAGDAKLRKSFLFQMPEERAALGDDRRGERQMFGNGLDGDGPLAGGASRSVEGIFKKNSGISLLDEGRPQHATERVPLLAGPREGDEGPFDGHAARWVDAQDGPPPRAPFQPLHRRQEAPVTHEPAEVGPERRVVDGGGRSALKARGARSYRIDVAFVPPTAPKERLPTHEAGKQAIGKTRKHLPRLPRRRWRWALFYSRRFTDRAAIASLRPMRTPPRSSSGAGFPGRRLWEGRPAQLRCPLTYKLAAASFGATALVAVLFSWVAGVVLYADVRPMLGFAFFAATIAIAAWRLPIHFREQLEFTVTDTHVGWKRGILRRSIERAGITYARIVWTAPGVGDLVLVRAVPTGALRRTLTLVLPDVAAPDAVLATIRGVTPAEPAQATARIDAGEQILWSAAPTETRWSPKQKLSSFGAALLFAFALATAVRLVRAVAKVIGLHALTPVQTAAFAGAVLIGLAMLFGAAGLLAWRSFFRSWFLRSRTRYLITDRRVLITRGAEELSLDRRNIAYVVATEHRALFAAFRGRVAQIFRRGAARRFLEEGRPSLAPPPPYRSTDLFLVLDGPRSRAVSAAGAFGGGDEDALMPVLTGIADAEPVRALLGA